MQRKILRRMIAGKKLKKTKRDEICLDFGLHGEITAEEIEKSESNTQRGNTPERKNPDENKYSKREYVIHAGENIIPNEIQIRKDQDCREEPEGCGRKIGEMILCKRSEKKSSRDEERRRKQTCCIRCGVEQNLIIGRKANGAQSEATKFPH